jgi:ankyrin repeat protein
MLCILFISYNNNHHHHHHHHHHHNNSTLYVFPNTTTDRCTKNTLLPIKNHQKHLYIPFKVAKMELTEEIQTILDSVNVHHQDDAGRTPLFHCIECALVVRVRYLLNLGADVEHQDKWGQTPLMYACALRDTWSRSVVQSDDSSRRTEENNVEMVQQKLDHGANIKYQDRYG